MNLLRLFEFYLMAMFVIGSVRRFGLYHSIARLVFALTKRYQRLLGKVKEQSSILLTWAMFVPAVITLLLWMIQAVLTRLKFPHAELTPTDLAAKWWYWPSIAIPAAGVVAIDLYFLIRVGRIDTVETEKYFHQAESWIGTWKAKAVRAATLGYINPQNMVDVEVKKALVSGGKLIHTTLWWTAAQTGLRVLLGICLWTVWANTGQHVEAAAGHYFGFEIT